MRYYLELSVPAETPASEPETKDLTLTPGIIEHVSLYFPPGSGGYLRIQIWLNAYQLVPWERGQWLRGDDLLIPDYGRYEVAEEPYLLTVKGWNAGTLYEHSCLVGVELTPYQMVALQGETLAMAGTRYE